MVTEIAEITVSSESAEDFPAAFERACTHLSGAAGFRGAQLTRSIETPLRFILMVQWETLADHTEGFRRSPAFDRWREVGGPFFAEPPRVEHVQVVSRA